ncbi:MAG: hypothetical protein EOO20_15205 [Chryseobacterium sp.]|nr:MAG: hypothetical protein EOO20_15205 [Chryseobacterium sp.]
MMIQVLFDGGVLCRAMIGKFGLNKNILNGCGNKYLILGILSIISALVFFCDSCVFVQLGKDVENVHGVQETAAIPKA